jgi:hypothetical protein
MNAETLVQLLSAGVAVIAASFAYLQVRSARIASYAALLTNALQRFHGREMRDLRYKVFMAANKPLHEWTMEEYIAAEEIGNYFAEVGFLMKNGYLDEEAFLDYWGVAAMRSFHACFPVIENRRQAEGSRDVYVYFEWLARHSLLNSRRNQWWQRQDWRKLIEATPDLLDGRYAIRPAESARTTWQRRDVTESGGPQAT